MGPAEKFNQSDQLPKHKLLKFADLNQMTRLFKKRTVSKLENIY